MVAFATVMICRKTGDRQIDIDEQYRDQVVDKLVHTKQPQSWVKLVSEISELDQAESKRAFGDALPTGLRLL